MAKTSQVQKGFLNMAGEFLVAAELNRRHILSAVTFGNSKSADVWAFGASSRRVARIEVKTTRDHSKAWVIGNKILVAENWTRDTFWILVLLPSPPSDGPANDSVRGRHAPRFFGFTAKELGKMMMSKHKVYCQKYYNTHGSDYTGLGVPKLSVVDAHQFENQWNKISDQVGAVTASSPN